MSGASLATTVPGYLNVQWTKNRKKKREEKGGEGKGRARKKKRTERKRKKRTRSPLTGWAYRAQSSAPGHLLSLRAVHQRAKKRIS